MAMLRVQAEWAEEELGGPVKLTVLLIEGGSIEEQSEQQCGWSQLPSRACELLHEVIGSSTPPSVGAFD